MLRGVERGDLEKVDLRGGSGSGSGCQGGLRGG